jgi:leucyl aminopeptidase
MARSWIALAAIAAAAATLVAAAPAPFHPAITKPGTGDSRLIALAPDQRVWMTAAQVLGLIRTHTSFIDVTDTPNLEKGDVPPRSLAFPAGPTHQEEVTRYIADVEIDRFRADLTTFSTFYTRYYSSQTGADSANWLFALVRDIAGNRSDITVQQFAHSFPQQSLIARIQGSDSSLPLVIIGAHQDSINSQDPSSGRSPGADDDGSGSITLVEALRVLVANNFRPRHTVEFQWYAAEEIGLVGSAAIANAYKADAVPVYAMFQLDMTAWTDGTSPVKVLSDFTDPDLTVFIKTLVKAYTPFELRDHRCGYGCSDHASWDRAGYPSSSVFEPVTNPRIHSTGDDLDLINWDQAESFIHLALGFVVETSYGV